MMRFVLIASALASKQHSNAAARIRRAARNRAAADVGIDPLPLQGKLAIVTGGGRGIGAAVAKALAQRGCRVLITYRSNVDAAADTMMALPGDGHDARQCDVTDADAVAQLFEDLGESVDIVINNAAIYEESHFLDASYEDWRRIWRDTLDANLIGPSNVIFHAGRSMARRGGGVIVCVSSRGAFRGEPTAPAYGASKAGLNQLSQSAAKALAPSNVVVGVVAPGFVDTAMAAEVLAGERGDAIRGDSPFNRVATVDEVAEAVLYFTHTNAKWSSGAIIDVNGASYLRS